MRKLDFRFFLLSAVGLVSFVAPMLFGQTNATQNRTEPQAETPALIAPTFEVASIKPHKSGDMNTGLRFLPDGFHATNITLQRLMEEAYGVKDDQISGAPNWVKSEKYDFDAKGDKSVADELQKLSLYPRLFAIRRGLQSILEDRFQLKYHRETKELPVYWLVEAKAGKLHAHEGDCGSDTNLLPPKPEPGNPHPTPCGGFFWGGSQIRGQNVSVTQFVDTLSRLYTDRVVVDKTGLAGKYDINLDWMPEPVQFGAHNGSPPNGMPPPPELDANGPSLFTAIQEQLGLKLESKKGPVEIIVIDHVERPSAN